MDRLSRTTAALVAGTLCALMVGCGPTAPPTQLGQFVDAATVAVGGETQVWSTFVFKGSVTAKNGPQAKLQVEVRPVGTAFTGTATAESAWVDNGQQASVNVTGFSPGNWRWQARTSATNEVSAWVSFGENAETSADFVVLPAPPPENLGQMVTPAPVGVGGEIPASSTMVFLGVIEGPQAKLQVEVRPVGTSFTGSPTVESDPGFGISQGVSGLAQGGYHWQARTSVANEVSEWVSFGDNSESSADFVILPATTPPPPVVPVPTSLYQWAYPASGYSWMLPAGATTRSSIISFGAIAWAQLEVEVKPTGVAFDGTATRTSESYSLSVRITLPMGSYHWRVRAVNANGTSQWVSFGANDEASPDFIIVDPTTATSWGANFYGQLGNGTSGAGSFAGTPTTVNGLDSVIAVSAGGNHTMALRADGTVWVWGRNDRGQLGNGTVGVQVETSPEGFPSTVETVQTTPVMVPGLTDVSGISAGGSHCVAWTSMGNVYAWGANDSGQLGDGTTTDRLTPTLVIPITSLYWVRTIAAGVSHTLASTVDGAVLAWGRNTQGQIGNGQASGQPVTIPTPVNGLSNVMAVAAGLSHSLALTWNGTVYAWGSNSGGVLGAGNSPYSTSPVQVTIDNQGTPLSDVWNISAGAWHSLASRSDGTVWTWGYNGWGQLGMSPDTQDVPFAQPVNGLSNVTAVAAGATHSVALLQDGTVRTWGANHVGQLGNGTTEPSFAPVTVLGPDNTPLTGVLAISAGSGMNAGGFHTVVIR